MGMRGTWALIMMCAFLTVGAVGKAAAQSQAIVLVVDQRAIIQSSEAGKSISTQVKTMRDAVSKELQAERDKVLKAAETAKASEDGFRKDVEAFQKEAGVMSPDQRAAKEKTLKAKAEELNKGRESIQQLARKAEELRIQRARELQKSISDATNELAKVLRPILEEIVAERKATLLIDKNDVMFSAPEFDVTDEVKKRLDAKLKTVKVEKASLPPPPKK